MLKTGCIILSLWGILGLAPALYFIFDIVFLGGIAPALSTINSEEIATLSPQMLRVTNSIAVFANGTHVAFSSLIIVAVWKGLYRRVVWVFWALLIAMPIALASGAMGNYMADTLFPEADILSALVLIAGICCSAIGLSKPRQ